MRIANSISVKSPEVIGKEDRTTAIEAVAAKWNMGVVDVRLLSDGHASPDEKAWYEENRIGTEKWEEFLTDLESL